MSAKWIFIKQLALAAIVVTTTGCTEPAPKPEEPPAEAVTTSHDRVCKFAERLVAFDGVAKPDTAELRYINEQWRELNLSRQVFPLAEATASRAILTKLNLALAHETVALLEQATVSLNEAYDQIEGLRRFARDPENMKVPDSIIRTMVNRLEDCCLNALKGNATTLVRETKNSPMYNVGALAYFINRDVNAVLSNELSPADYQTQITTAKQALPAFEPVAVTTTWAQCPALTAP